MNINNSGIIEGNPRPLLKLLFEEKPKKKGRGKMKNKNHTLNLYKYCNKVYDLGQKISQIRDGRINPKVELPVILLTVLFSLLTYLHSFNAIEKAIKDGDFDKFFNYSCLPSRDTIVYALLLFSLKDLREYNKFIVQKARHNKSLKANTIEGLKVVAIDGSDTFSMSSERLGKQAHKIEHKNEDGEITSIEYREKAICASYVGKGYSPILKIKRIPKGEGELTAAKKLVDELNRDHHQYCDIIVVDSLFINAPFINRVLSYNKDPVIRVKQENNLIKNAEGLFKNREPDHVFEDVTPKDEEVTSGELYDIEIWEEEDFTWSNVNKSLRVLKVKETRKRVNAAGEILEEETQICYYATTRERSRLKAFTVWKIAHRRWDEENGVFHWLKTYLDLEHRYSHMPHVIQAMYYLFVLAYNLFHLYIYRNLRSFNPGQETKKKFLRRIYKGIIMLTEPLYDPKSNPG
jgi:hypothetical protein